MEFVVADKELMETGLLRNANIDFDLGDTNDFEMKLSVGESESYGLKAKESFLFSPGTEFGGRVEYIKTVTNSGEITWRGQCWRGLLEKSRITPQTGQDYRIVSGDAHTIFHVILPEGGDAGTFFRVPGESAGATFSAYKFDRYTSKLAGLTKMLLTKGYRLSIKAEHGGSGQQFIVWVRAVPIADYSDEIEYSQDSRITITIEADYMGINHLICLGRGDLAARQRIDLYVDKTGQIVTASPYYTGLDMRTDVYANNGVESLADLESGGRDRLMETMSKRTMDLRVTDYPVEIGDIVGGRDRRTGITLTKPVTGMILRADGDKGDIEIKVEGGSEDNADY
jgi:hypothetical protein